jgi:hypothetical protein
MRDRHVTFDAIVNAVGAVVGLGRAEIMAARQFAPGSRARCAIWWLATRMTELGVTTIARLSSDRDHSSVLSGLKTAENLRENDPEFRILTDTVLGTLLALERHGMLRLADAIDPIAAARRVLAAPEREAVRVSAYEIIAMSQLIVELHGPNDDPTPELELNHAHAA